MLCLGLDYWHATHLIYNGAPALLIWSVRLDVYHLNLLAPDRTAKDAWLPGSKQLAC